jgi:hypothetical protein
MVTAMTEVPWWYGTIAHVMAIGLSVWLGLHYKVGAEWLLLYGAAAAASAMLPSKRIAGAIGVVAGVVVAAGGIYLMRNAGSAIQPSQLFALHGGALTATREAAMLGLTVVWLLAGSALRFRWL